MNESEVANDVKEFLYKYIHSVEQLEVLLLLKSSVEKKWQVAEISEQLRSPENSIKIRLEDLCGRGLCQKTPEGYYYTSTPLLNDTVEKLARAYKDRRIKVIELIFSKPLDKLRNFSDAFKIKGDK